VLRGLPGELRDQHAERVALEAAQRVAIEALDQPVYELPLATDGIDMGTLYRFAELLRAQRMIG
jgi:hypothetical protein